MRKILALTAVLGLIAGTAQAGSWSMNCVNHSCEAAQGAIKFYFSAQPGGRFVVQRLTGVEGLPISAEDFQQQEEALNASIEKSTSKTRATNAGMDASSAESGSGAKIGGNSGSSIGLTKKQTMSNSSSKGKKVTINYTLAFFSYFAATTAPCNTRDATDIQRYMCAAEEILNEYNRDGGQAIKDQMYGFLFSIRAPKIMPSVDMTAKTTQSNNEMQTYKYAGLMEPLAGDDRWSRGYQAATQAAANDTDREKFNKQFFSDMKTLKLMMKPGMTSKKLEQSGNLKAAVSKWMIDSGEIRIDEKMKGIDSLADKYLSTMSIWNYGDKEVQDFFSNRYKSADPKTKDIVSVKVDWKSRIITGVIICLILIAAAAGGWWYRKKKPRVVETV